MKYFAMIIAVFLAPFLCRLYAVEIHVTSVAHLQSSIDTASAGDVLVLANGTYLNSSLYIGTDNITVRAATPGGVFLNGANAITISGNAVTFSGFQFTSGSISQTMIIVSGNYVTLTQLNFNSYSAPKYINLQGQYDVISYCNFENKPTTAPKGNLIHVSPDSTIPRYAKIRYCSFKNMPGAGGDNGNECIRISNGATSSYICRTVVEYCYFENTGAGDSEVISVKCAENVLRYNTMNNNIHGNFCFRNGDSNIAYSNFFISSGGIRIKVANNIYCYNNYFQNCGDGSITAPIKYVYDNGVGIPSHLANLNIIHNTIIDGTSVEFDSHAIGNTWANNIIHKSSGNVFTGGGSGITWAGNMYQGTLGLTIPTGMINVDPKLVVNTDGYYGLSSTSPAIDAASASYPPILDIAGIDDDPALAYDISGQARPSTKTLKDVGCVENHAIGAVINRPLKATDVGASYLGGPTGVERNPAQNRRGNAFGFFLLESYPNPFNPSTTIKYELSVASHVLLRVYDPLGREVATLVDGIQTQGIHYMRWNASHHPSGVYLCRLQSESRTEIMKLVLAK